MTQFLLTTIAINRRTYRAALVGMLIGVYFVVTILSMVVGYGYLGIMMGVAAVAVIAIILVNNFNSAKSISGGRNVRQ